MGGRVHYVVVRGGQVRNAILGGGYGYGLDYHVAVGPELVLAWLDERAQVSDPAPGREWLGDTLCEGGVLLDTDRRLMLVFTELPWLDSSDAAYAGRRAMLDGWSRTWPGWRIEWAYDGLADLARYVGADPECLHDLGPPDDPPIDPDDAGYLVTIDGVSWVLSGYAAAPWEHSVRLIDLLASREPITVVDHVPFGGLHLRVGSKLPKRTLPSLDLVRLPISVGRASAIAAGRTTGDNGDFFRVVPAPYAQC